MRIISALALIGAATTARLGTDVAAGARVQRFRFLGAYASSEDSPGALHDVFARRGILLVLGARSGRTAELLVERGAMPPVITRASAVGAERSRELFEEAYREHARRLAHAIDQQGGA